MASVVGTYARAFVDVVIDSKADGARMLAELRSMQSLFAESDQLRRVMDNPSIPGEQKRAVLDAVIQKIGGSRPVRNFIAVLTDHRRLPLFSEIVSPDAVPITLLEPATPSTELAPTVTLLPEPESFT